MMSSVIHRNSISLHCRPTCHFLVGGALCNQAYFCLCSECALSLHAVVELGVENIISNHCAIESLVQVIRVLQKFSVCSSFDPVIIVVAMAHESDITHRSQEEAHMMVGMSEEIIHMAKDHMPTDHMKAKMILGLIHVSVCVRMVLRSFL